MTGRNNTGQASESLSRRDVLGALGAAGAVSVAGCGVLDGDDDEGESTEQAETVTIGISIPREGRWQDEGEQLHDGYLLAAEHINDASGLVTAGDGYEPPFAESGEGLLGQTVELDVRDTGSTEDGARSSAEALVSEDVVMFAGGGSAGEGMGHQAVASEAETVYMGGFTPTNQVGGEACSGYGFNEIHNSRMAADALGAVVSEALGGETDIAFAQLYPDNDIGNEMASVVQSRFETVGWTQNVTDSTRVGARSYSGVIADVLETGPDMLVLNYTGLAGASALRDLHDVVGEEDELTVLVPMMNRELLRSARAGLEGVFGTVPWTPALNDPFSEQFLEHWESTETEMDVPSGLSHLAYVQLYQYGAAVERAGTFEPAEVIAELEGSEYDVGLGAAEMRACDHQSTRQVPVVRGLPEPQQEPGSYTELVDLVDASYPCEESPAADCEL